jgi:hypothetical protein
MIMARIENWNTELRTWLSPFLEKLGHKARRQMCPLYLSGLIGPGDRKSVQPMAERFAPGDYDQLHHFVAAGVWDAAPLETELLTQADRLVGGNNAVLVIDDTAMPKKGEHSVGVAAQYASALGKTANCQTLVSLTLAQGEVPVMVALRLFLPESWTSDLVRLKRAGVQAEYQTARTKPEIALAEIDRMITAGVRFGCVLADAGYGQSAPFRQALTARKLAWAVGTFSREDFTFDKERNVYTCPAGKTLTTTDKLVNDGETVLYRASAHDCGPCPLKPKCCPKTPGRKIPHSIYEEARDVARALAKTEAFEQSRRDRKRVEMLFAHLKRILKLGRLRLRGTRGAQNEFTLAAIAQNLRRLVKLVVRPPPAVAAYGA